MKKEAERLLKEAQKSLEKGAISPAIDLYEKYLKVYDRNDVRVLQELADLYSQLTDIKNAIRCYLSAAKILKKDGFYSKAKVLLDKILEIDESNLEAITEKIELLKFIGCNDDARLLQYRLAEVMDKKIQLCKEQGLTSDAQILQDKLDQLKSQIQAKRREAQREEEKPRRAIAIAAVEAAIAKGDEDAEKFLRDIFAKIGSALKIETDCPDIENVDYLVARDLLEAVRLVGGAVRDLPGVRRSLELIIKSNEDDPVEMADAVQCLRLLALIYRDQQNYGEARECLKEAKKYASVPGFTNRKNVLLEIAVSLKNLEKKVKAAQPTKMAHGKKRRKK